MVVCDVVEATAQATVDKIRAAGDRATVRAFDLTDPAACRSMIEVQAEFGRIDVPVNNAGVNRRGDLAPLATFFVLASAASRPDRSSSGDMSH